MKLNRWWYVVAATAGVNMALALVAMFNGGSLWGGHGEAAISAGLRADLVKVETPWLDAPLADRPAQLRLDLEQGREKLANAVKKGEAKIEREVPPALLCREWGPLLPDQIQRVKDSLADWTGQKEQQQKQTVIGYIVFLPKSRVDEGVDINALGQMGLTDLFYMTSPGPLKGGISMGIFRDQERAQQHLDELESRGVQGAELRPRLGTERTFFRLTGVEEQIKQLEKIYMLNRRSELGPCEPLPG